MANGTRPGRGQGGAGAALAGGGARRVAAARGLAQVSDEAELVAVVDGVLAASPTEVERYRDGDEKERKKRGASSWAG